LDEAIKRQEGYAVNIREKIPAPAPEPEPAPRPKPTRDPVKETEIIKLGNKLEKLERDLVDARARGDKKRVKSIQSSLSVTRRKLRDLGIVVEPGKKPALTPPAPPAPPTPKAPTVDPKIAPLQTKMQDLYVQLDVARAAGDKRRIKSIQSSLSVTRRKIKDLGGVPIGPGERPGVVTTPPAPTPAPRPRRAPKPAGKPPEPKVVVTKTTVIKQRTGAGAKERAGVYRQNIKALGEEQEAILKRLLQGVSQTEKNRLERRLAAIDKLLTKQTTGLAKAEARLAKSPSARRGRIVQGEVIPGGPDKTLTPQSATSTLNKVDDHRTKNLSDEGRELHDESWKQARRLNKVHKTPQEMTQMDVYGKDSFGGGSSAQGQYHPVYKQATVNAAQLEAGNRLDQGAINLTTWHEIGHGMDYQWMGASNKARGYGAHLLGRTKVADEILESRRTLMKKLMDSERVQDLIEAIDTGDFRGRSSPSAKYLGYVTSEVEVFARGYSQYAATVLDDGPALKYCEKRTTSRSWGFGHWTAEEFAPLKEAFDDFFREAGMLP
jgi:hypothetical protein